MKTCAYVRRGPGFCPPFWTGAVTGGLVSVSLAGLESTVVAAPDAVVVTEPTPAVV